MSSETFPTRQRILQATLDLLEDETSPRTRMSDIAKAAKISRQALYLHFPNRLDLLIATVRYVDEIKKVDDRLARSRAARSGSDRLAAWVEAWANYIPEIHGVARALIAMADTDAEARAAWQDRQRAIREGCAAVTLALERDGLLTPFLTTDEAADLLAAMVSVSSWEALCRSAGWSQARYVEVMQDSATRTLVVAQ